MKTNQYILLSGMFTLLLMASAPHATAQVHTTGTPGSPSATTTLDGRYLQIHRRRSAASSTSTPRTRRHIGRRPSFRLRGRRMFLLIITDDVGYGAPSTFGGLIPTPAMDRVANAGLRFTQFHSTALCSPTRASLITGRNHHSVGFGVITENSTGYPGYNSVITKDKATVGTILKDNGYATSSFGKNHNTPAFQESPGRPVRSMAHRHRL